MSRLKTFSRLKLDTVKEALSIFFLDKASFKDGELADDEELVEAVMVTAEAEAIRSDQA